MKAFASEETELKLTTYLSLFKKPQVPIREEPLPKQSAQSDAATIANSAPKTENKTPQLKLSDKIIRKFGLEKEIKSLQDEVKKITFIL